MLLVVRVMFRDYFTMLFHVFIFIICKWEKVIISLTKNLLYSILLQV